MFEALKRFLPQRKTAGTPSDPLQLWREIFGAQPTKSGQEVTWRTALQATTALACARVIADGLAQVPFKLYRKDGQARSEAVEEPLSALVSGAPNEYQTSYEFREQLALHLVFCGQAFVFVNRLGSGRIFELLPFQPQDVTVKQAKTGWGREYIVRAGDTNVPIPSKSMWHIRGPSWDGVIGLDGVKLAREAIGLSLATEEHGARLFSNGAQPAGILYTDGSTRLDKEQRTALRRSWEDTYGGGGNAHRTAVLWGGMKWQSIATNNEQAQFLETRRFQVEEVCRAMRVMPIMVGHADKSATYASAEQMFLAHVVHTLMPWYARVEQSADLALLTPAQRKGGLYHAFNASALLRGDYKSRQEGLQIQRRNGIITTDEWRAMEEMNPVGAAKGGDILVVEANMQPLKDVGVKPAAPVAPTTPSAQPIESEDDAGDEAEDDAEDSQPGASNGS